MDLKLIPNINIKYIYKPNQLTKLNNKFCFQAEKYFFVTLIKCRLIFRGNILNYLTKSRNKFNSLKIIKLLKKLDFSKLLVKLLIT